MTQLVCYYHTMPTTKGDSQTMTNTTHGTMLVGMYSYTGIVELLLLIGALVDIQRNCNYDESFIIIVIFLNIN